MAVHGLHFMMHKIGRNTEDYVGRYWYRELMEAECLSQFTLRTDCVTVMKFTQYEIAFKGYDNM